MKAPLVRSTTVLAVRREGKVAVAADGQVTVGATVVKQKARKVRRLFEGKVLAGFAGSGADAVTLFDRLEGKLGEFGGNLARAAVELAREWRSDRVLRRLDAMLVAADKKTMFLLSGSGDVIEPDGDAVGIGSGGPYAVAAARALLSHTSLGAVEVARESLKIAAEICIYTNAEIAVEDL